MSVGVYIHIPFCESHCYYCAFYSVVERTDMYDIYLDSLLREIEMRANESGSATVDSIYFGGGTPSLFGADRIYAVIEACRKVWPLDTDSELTMEANPSSLAVRDYELYRDIGINRISLGVQSFSDFLLRKIGRIHTAHQAIQAVRRAYQAGLTNISVDLMYGLPNQSTNDFRNSLLQVVHLPVSHVSVYGLTVEDGTYFGVQKQKNRLALPSENEEWEMYQDMCRILPHYGFERYEIANFARHGKRARHNQKYWHYRPYLGFGAAATSYIGNTRRTNVADWKQYVAEIDGDGRWYEEEILTKLQQVEEYVFMHLRTRTGINTEHFKERFGHSFNDYYSDSFVQSICRSGLLSCKGRLIHLTDRGMALANSVMAEFILV